MRVTNKWGVGVIVAAAVLLTGCSGTSEKPEPSSASDAPASQEADAPQSDCPELTVGATIDGATLGPCIADAMADTAGYAAKTSVMGVESTTRFNPGEHAIESDSPVGSIIVIGDDVWVKSAASEWQTADPASSDPIVAALSSSAAQVASLDPAAMATALTGDFTVTGTGTRLGQEVFLLSGQVQQQGATVEIVSEVTADYVTLASTSSASLNGQSVQISMEVTEWDVKQDIVAPL
ncbi:hypothetical protein [Microbacterium sp. XT11]|uniref:hypothetical protein n=1 Tax=Microbacterium sp. XT11 TaxID=367477 RepID=UPI000742FADE|nr:hypothetical protein [Microbacterium sp. XT11]ALX65979.1 hypothetical protein AB663_000809 [Microbacterium sp. XT11]